WYPPNRSLNVQLLVQAVDSFTNRERRPPLLVISCPYSLDERSRNEIGELEKLMHEHCEGVADLDFVSQREMVDLYPVSHDEYFAAEYSSASDVQYSPLLFATLG